MRNKPDDDAKCQLGGRYKIEGVSYGGGGDEYVDKPEGYSHNPYEPCQLRKAFAHWIFRLHMTRIAWVDQLILR
jgi:hypothetical protein